MDHQFYDVKKKSKVTVPVTGKTTYGEPGKLRYAFKGTSESGGKLTAFVSKDTWDKADVAEV
jgi:hypothetical protein